jgi:hypothetical protein
MARHIPFLDLGVALEPLGQLRDAFLVIGKIRASANAVSKRPCLNSHDAASIVA